MKKKRKYTSYSEETRKKIVQEYAETDLSVRDLQKKHNIGFGTIRYWLSNSKNALVKRKKRRKRVYENDYPWEIIKKSLSDYENGESVVDIARKYGISAPGGIIYVWKNKYKSSANVPTPEHNKIISKPPLCKLKGKWFHRCCEF